MFLTDTEGIRMDENDPETLIYEISRERIFELIDNEIISGGMLPKVMACVKAIDMGVNRVHILSGMIPHPIILEIFTHSGIGTMIKP